MHEMEKPDGWITIDLRDGAVEGEEADEMEEGYVHVQLRSPSGTHPDPVPFSNGQSTDTGLPSSDRRARESSERKGHPHPRSQGMGTQAVSVMSASCPSSTT